MITWLSTLIDGVVDEVRSGVYTDIRGSVGGGVVGIGNTVSVGEIVVAAGPRAMANPIMIVVTISDLNIRFLRLDIWGEWAIPQRISVIS